METKTLIEPTTSPYIIVQGSPIHGQGVYAKIDIPKGTRIIQYVGERITKKEAGRRVDASIDRHKKDGTQGAVYIFELNKRHDIDGEVPYNTARLINHSCDPNCEVEIIRGRIWVISLRDIKKDEELFYNYGYDFEDYQQHPCRCGTTRCVGYIIAEEHWPRLPEKAFPKPPDSP